MFSIVGFTLLTTMVVIRSAGAVFTLNGHGCSTNTEIMTARNGKSGTLYTNDNYQQDCDWTVDMPVGSHGIIMHIYDVWIDCNRGHLRFRDESGEGCGICEVHDIPSEYCQIYIKENTCREDEIWAMVAKDFRYCQHSVIHIGLEDLHLHMVTEGQGQREFHIDYKVIQCQGANGLQDVLPYGPPLIHDPDTSTLKDHCPLILEPQKKPASQTTTITLQTPIVIQITNGTKGPTTTASNKFLPAEDSAIMPEATTRKMAKVDTVEKIETSAPTTSTVSRSTAKVHSEPSKEVKNRIVPEINQASTPMTEPRSNDADVTEPRSDKVNVTKIDNITHQKNLLTTTLVNVDINKETTPKASKDNCSEKIEILGLEWWWILLIIAAVIILIETLCIICLACRRRRKKRTYV